MGLNNDVWERKKGVEEKERGTREEREEREGGEGRGWGNQCVRVKDLRKGRREWGRRKEVVFSNGGIFLLHVVTSNLFLSHRYIVDLFFFFSLYVYPFVDVVVIVVVVVVPLSVHTGLYVCLFALFLGGERKE
ncbi:hypothetical protein, unlikely [Trypanosoma brucei gambiense DAL972]|uniref:Uncharacterized protein n=1 Tax=Trypanosoma brucei gambiense (strain MHOM/CI/86/DAL972) TaxID=679716 RepID=C9ZYT3_TRYB9|nr:hypothetical protein, unlikely [Trypanosoma brucei gambiense DAL972]CBH14582.1 hypothetical protein, unlikely [Trypanosoma brucei gambiense DAL972]|eukprot:XP_011776848.1 hypothetical protein, unlikely [Trypanosoma brucei gambiense DAL972]